MLNELQCDDKSLTNKTETNQNTKFCGACNLSICGKCNFGCKVVEHRCNNNSVYALYVRGIHDNTCLHAAEGRRKSNNLQRFSPRGAAKYQNTQATSTISRLHFENRRFSEKLQRNARRQTFLEPTNVGEQELKWGNNLVTYARLEELLESSSLSCPKKADLREVMSAILECQYPINSERIKVFQNQNRLNEQHIDLLREWIHYDDEWET